MDETDEIFRAEAIAHKNIGQAAGVHLYPVPGMALSAAVALAIAGTIVALLISVRVTAAKERYVGHLVALQGSQGIRDFCLDRSVRIAHAVGRDVSIAVEGDATMVILGRISLVRSGATETCVSVVSNAWQGASCARCVATMEVIEPVRRLFDAL